MQGRDKDADTENTRGSSRGKRGREELREQSIYTWPCVKQTASGKLLYSTVSSAL